MPSARSSPIEPVGMWSTCHAGVFAQTHDRTLAELLFDLPERRGERFLFIGRRRDRFELFFGSHKEPPARLLIPASIIPVAKNKSKKNRKFVRCFPAFYFSLSSVDGAAACAPRSICSLSGTYAGGFSPVSFQHVLYPYTMRGTPERSSVMPMPAKRLSSRMAATCVACR